MPRAFIIDDESGIRMALRRWFERSGYSVCEASTGDEAWTLLSGEKTPTDEAPSVIVCDVHLPGLSGEELLARTTATQPHLTDRFILTTGDAVAGARPDSLLAQHPFVLQKPFDLATLKAMVQMVGGGS